MHEIEREIILSQVDELAESYRTTKEKDDWYDGPTTRWEFFKALWKDRWDRLKAYWKDQCERTFTYDFMPRWMGIILIGTAVTLFGWLWLDSTQKSRVTDTPECDRACMRSCSSIDGLMIEQTKYGCTCYLGNGEKRVLK